jgi:VWFA-related protein
MSPLSRCFALLLCAVAAAGQTVSRPPRARASKKNAASSQPAPTLLMVDAAADDSDGKPVRDLTAADFALSLNGEPRKIASVRYVDTRTGSVSPASGVMLSPDQVHRTLVLIADDLGLTASESTRVRGALTRFLNEHLQSRDLVSILRTSAGEGALQALTNDRRKLDQAIRSIRYNPAKGGEEAAAAGARGAIRMALSGLGDVEGRKAVILFTGNSALIAKAAPDAMVNSAHSASVVFSVVDVRTEADSPSAAAPGLDVMSKQTGGRFIPHATDLASALESVMQDQDGYYLVGYESSAAPTDLFTGRLLPQHPILTATRAGVQLHARSGMVKPSNFRPDIAERDLWRPSFTTPVADLRRGLTNPFDASAIPIRFVAAFAVTASGGAIEGHTLIDAKDLTFTHQLDGRITSTLDIQIAAFDENGQALSTESHTYAMVLNQEGFEKSMKSGFTATPNLTVRGFGAYQVHVSVRDGISGRIGSASQFLEVPDTSSGQLFVTGIAMSIKNHPELSLPPLHIFRAHDVFTYTYQILNLRADENKRSEVEGESRILRGNETMFAGKPTPLEFSTSEDPKRRSASAEVRLGDIEPGAYVLELKITDKLSKEPRTTTQYAWFEVE